MKPLNGISPVKGTPAHNSWVAMRKRCGPKHVACARYWQQGITICARWDTFVNFLEDMGERPLGKTLDRRDNTKGYYLENCRWATRVEQENNKTNNVMVTHEGVTATLAQITQSLGVNYYTTYQRLSRGWLLADALSPLDRRRREAVNNKSVKGKVLKEAA